MGIKQHAEIAPYRHVDRAQRDCRHHGLWNECDTRYYDIRHEQASHFPCDKAVLPEHRHVGQLYVLACVAVFEQIARYEEEQRHVERVYPLAYGRHMSGLLELVGGVSCHHEYDAERLHEGHEPVPAVHVSAVFSSLSQSCTRCLSCRLRWLSAPCTRRSPRAVRSCRIRPT